MSEPDEIPSARFYEGTILVVNVATQRGMLRSRTGRELPFAARDVRVQGHARDFGALAAGMHVGFDVARTSSGLVVSTIHVFDAAEGQSGSEVR